MQYQSHYRHRGPSRAATHLSALFVSLALLGGPAAAFQSTASSQSIGITSEQARSAGPGHPWQGGPASVNPYSLAKQTSVPLMRWTARGGLPVDFTLHHNSQAVSSDPALGSKWKHSYDTALWVSGGGSNRSAAVVWGDHRVQMFGWDGVKWVASDGYRAELVPVGDSYALVLESQMRLDFVPASGPMAFPRRHRLASISDASGNALALGYDSVGRLVSVTDPSGRAVRLEYASGKLDAVLFVAGSMTRRWDIGHDSGGRLQTITWPDVTSDNGPETHSMQLAYDSSGNVVTLSDREGNLWTYGYDGNRLAFEQWPANSVAQRMLYVYAGNVRRVQDPRGVQSEYQYDGLSRLVRSQDPAGNSTTFVYGDADYAFGTSRVTKPSGDVYRYDYDQRGNVVGYTDPSGQRWDYTYDARNNRTLALEPLVTDAWGVTEPDRHRTEYDHDAGNHLAQVREYTSSGTILVSKWTYDGFGQVKTFVNARNQVSLYQHDTYGNMTRLESPMHRIVRWVFDDAEASLGFTTAQAWIDGLSKRIELVKDEWGRLRTKDFPIGTDHRYTYDGSSRLVRMQDESGDTHWAYDPNGRLIHSDRGSWTIDYAYHPNGLLLHRMDIAPAGPRDVDYGYDGSNLLASMQDGGATTVFFYDVDGRLVQRTYPNAARTEYGYSKGRLASVANYDGFGVLVAGSSYGYQKNALLCSAAEQDGSLTRYGYDYLNRLVREERQGPAAHSYLWSYDEVGNRVAQNRSGSITTYAHDGDNRLVQAIPQGAGPDTYVWNGNGQLTERSRQNGLEQFRFSYDLEGRLTQMLEWNGSFFEPSSIHGYDGLGRRWTRDAFTAGIPVEHSEFFYDGSDVVREQSVTQGQPSTTVMMWGGSSLLGTRDLLAGNATWNATDGLGDLRRSTDASGQMSVFRAIYNAFGEITHQVGSAPTYALGADLGVRSEGDAGMAFTGAGFYDQSTSTSLPSWAGACVAVMCAECGACPPNPHKPGCSVQNPPPPPPGPLDGGCADGNGESTIDLSDLPLFLDAFAGAQETPTFKLPPPPADTPDEELPPTTRPPDPEPTVPPPQKLSSFGEHMKELRERSEAAKQVFPPRRKLGVASGWKQR